MGLFEHKELDYQKTKKNVMKVIHKYERCLMRIGSNAQPRMTANYSLDMPGSSNEFNSKVENAVAYQMDEQPTDEQYVRKVVDVLNSMKEDYRTIIVMSFFDQEINSAVANELHIGLTKLAHKKRLALELFAYGMGVERYLNNKTNEVRTNEG